MEQKPVKRLNRELKYKGNILDIYEDTVDVIWPTGILSTIRGLQQWFL